MFIFYIASTLQNFIHSKGLQCVLCSKFTRLITGQTESSGKYVSGSMYRKGTKRQIKYCAVEQWVEVWGVLMERHDTGAGIGWRPGLSGRET